MKDTRCRTAGHCVCGGQGGAVHSEGLTDTEEQCYSCDPGQNDRVLPRKEILVQNMITVHKRLEEDKRTRGHIRHFI